MRLMFGRSKTAAAAEVLYAAIVAEARRPDWYREAGVPDTMDGRFAVLATLLALADLRLERGGGEARGLGPRLAECFITDMDAQMREAGFGDPSLGKQVRMLVGSLAGRVDRWRRAIEASEPWAGAARSSLYRDRPPEAAAAEKGAAAIRAWWERLQRISDSDLQRGRIA